MAQINGWRSVTLGDGMWASTVSAQIEKEFIAAFEALGSPADMAVFTRGEEGELHCEVFAYFSPAAQTLAMRFDAESCGKPARRGLGLLAGGPRCWAILFPEAKE